MDVGTERSTAAKRYANLETRRHFYLESARRSAVLTIPSLFPSAADARDKRSPADIPAPWQNFGAYAVESLTSKYLLTSLPPGQAFYRSEISEQSLDEARAEGFDETDIESLRTEVQAVLTRREKTVMREIDTGTYRIGAAETFRHLIVAGNVLVHMPKEGGGLRVFHLDRYVVRRGPMGKVMEIVVKETMDTDALPPEVANLRPSGTAPQGVEEDVDIYTHIQLVDGRYEMYQEAYAQVVPGTEGSVPEDKLPWLPLRFTVIEGEDYGRGYVEQYRGALNSLEVLRGAIVENSAAAARVLFLVRAGGMTKVKALEQAPNGAYITGDANDVTVLRMDKQGDMQIARQTAQELIQELSFAFLLNSAIQRDAERVTAEEIRAMARELEATQGGVWTVLTQELQLPMVKRIEANLTRKGELAPLPKGVVEPVVVTGLQAIGRSADMTRLRGVLADLEIAARVQPAIVQWIKPRELALRIFVNHGEVEEGLLKTNKEFKAEQAEAQRAMMNQKATEAIPKIVEEGASQMLAGQGQPQQAA